MSPHVTIGYHLSYPVEKVRLVISPTVYAVNTVYHIYEKNATFICGAPPRRGGYFPISPLEIRWVIIQGGMKVFWQALPFFRGLPCSFGKITNRQNRTRLALSEIFRIFPPFFDRHFPLHFVDIILRRITFTRSYPHFPHLFPPRGKSSIHAAFAAFFRFLENPQTWFALIFPTRFT